MKKILLALVVVLMLASPAAAAHTIFIDDTPYYEDTIVQDGSIYVPLRFIAEKMGAQVKWIEPMAVITTINKPKIAGDDDFVKMVNNALDLLKAKDPVDYELVCEYAGEITLIDRPGSAGWTSGSNICIGKDLLKDSALNNPIFVASVLVHESIHNANCKYGIIDKKAQENIAYLHDINVLRILNAPQYLIDNSEQTRKEVMDQ